MLQSHHVLMVSSGALRLLNLLLDPDKEPLVKFNQHQHVAKHHCENDQSLIGLWYAKI